MRLSSIVAGSMIAAGCAAPTQEADDAPTPSAAQAIVAGSASPRAQDAVVLISEVGAPACTGTLIAPNLVLTARHCVTYYDEDTECGAPLGGELGASLLTVSVGVHASAPGAVARAAHLHVPSAPDLCGADLALVVLDDDVDGVAPATVRFTPPAVGETGTAVGYGDAGTGRRQRTGVEVLAIGPARAAYTTSTGESLPLSLPDNEIVTGESTCYGDSGGPLLDALGQVIAVASRGVDDLCRDRPTFWTTLGAHESLIRSAAVAAGHPLPAAAAPRAGVGTDSAVRGDGPTADGRGDDAEDDGRTPRRGPAATASAGCGAAPGRAPRSVDWLGPAVGLVAARRRRRGRR